MRAQVKELDGSTVDSLLGIAPPAPRMPRLPEPPYLQAVGIALATNPPGILTFERKQKKHAEQKTKANVSHLLTASRCTRAQSAKALTGPNLEANLGEVTGGDELQNQL